MMENEIEILRIFRLPPRGQLAVELGTRRYRHLNEIEDAASRQRVIAAIGELVGFAGGYKSLVDAGVAPALQPESRSADAPSPLNVAQARFMQSLELQTLAMKGAVAPALSPESAPAAEVVTPAFLDEAPPQQRKPTVELLNPILERHLRADPRLANRRIFLEKAGDAGFRIHVDGRSYARLDEIPDKAVYQALKKAVQEWKKSQ
jgi:hypothetical protein